MWKRRYIRLTHFHPTISEYCATSKFTWYCIQILKIAAEGVDLVRLTVQGRFEADACVKIRESLFVKGCDVPLVADIHFAPAVALRVAEAFEKVRINPGNFADGKKSFENKVYDTRVSDWRIVIWLLLFDQL